MKNILFFTNLLLIILYTTFVNPALAQKNGGKGGKNQQQTTGGKGSKNQQQTTGGKGGKNQQQTTGGKGGKNQQQTTGGKGGKNTEGKGGKMDKEKLAEYIKNKPDEAFEKFKTMFFKKYWKLNPEAAAYNGLAEYDTILTIPSIQHIALATKAYQDGISELKMFENANLNPNNKTDYTLIQNALESSVWYLNSYKSHEWNPSTYAIGESFDRIVTNEKFPLEERLKRAYAKMKNVPKYYQTARNNLKKPTLEHTNLAIQQMEGTKAVFEQMSDYLAKADTTKFKKQAQKAFNKQLLASIAATESFTTWLKDTLRPTLTPQTARNFRIGKDLFNQKFKYDIQSEFTAEQMYQKALAEKSALHQKMSTLTQKMWSKYFGDKPKPQNDLDAVKMLIDRLSLKHTTQDSFLIAIEKQIPELALFVKQNNIIYLDPSKPLQVRKTPDYMAGVAGASISAPGPFEEKRPTYYNVTPLTHYSEEQAENYLREYNHYMLQILNIHEAIPGHYIQLLYSNKAPSLVKSIFGNDAMIEGWACYTERMMLEEGYGKQNNEQDELWLMYYKWNLRIACNTIIDYSIHALNMTEDECLKLLTQEAFQQETEAQSKWNRATLTQVQLCSYFSGLSDIYELRETEKKRLGKKFDLKKFHEQFLSYGSAPVNEIKKLMLAENKK